MPAVAEPTIRLMIDATHRGGVRNLNELNLARLEAMLEQRAAALEARIDLSVAQLELKIIRRDTTLGFWILQAATVALVFALVKLAL